MCSGIWCDRCVIGIVCDSVCVCVQYLLPVLRGHHLHLVCRNQILQHPGDHDELGAVRVHFHPKEKPGQTDHVLTAAAVVGSQILWHLL